MTVTGPPDDYTDQLKRAAHEVLSMTDIVERARDYVHNLGGRRPGAQAMKAGTDRRIPRSSCLHCGEQLDDATSVGGVDASPDPDDITVCLRCGHIMAFADDLTMRPLTDAEVRKVAGDKRILAIQAARARRTGAEAMSTHKVYIDDYSWFSVTLNDAGEPEQVIECRVVWSPGREPDNAMMSERIKRAIEQARAALKKNYKT